MDTSRFATKLELTESKGDWRTSLAELRADFANFRAEFAEDRAELRREFAEDRIELRREFADLRSDFASMQRTFSEDRTANVKWMVTLAAVIVSVLGGWITLSTRPQASGPVAGNQPIIIYATPAPPGAAPR